MKVLILNKSPWDDRLPNGNTLSNLFSEWSDTEFACIYCRDAAPSNRCCSKYLAISPLQVAKNLFTPWRIGKTITSINGDYSNEISAEKKISNISKSNRTFFCFANELIYKIGVWQNYKYKTFIHNFNPDIIFCFGVPDPVLYRTLKYVKKNTKAKIITYYVDDLYFSKEKTALLRWIGRNRLEKMAILSDKCYGISQLMCDEYSSIFKKEFNLLIKGCQIQKPKNFFNKPVRFVYAGNLLYNRHKSLGALASVLQRVNNDGLKVTLDIYTATTVSEEIKKTLCLGESSCLHPSKPFDEIKEVMHAADIVLHVESFDIDQIDIVRLSFSTKITDCMQSGSVMMAIGPSGIASIEYPKNNIPGAIVVTSLENLNDIVKDIVSNPEQIIERAVAINDFANKSADINHVRQRLKKELENLVTTN